MLFHANFVFEVPNKEAQPENAEAVYRKLLKLIMDEGCAARGVMHAIEPSGCSCNLMDEKTVLAANQKEVEILARGAESSSQG